MWAKMSGQKRKRVKREVGKKVFEESYELLREKVKKTEIILF